jgi:hypothetical protein
MLIDKKKYLKKNLFFGFKIYDVYLKKQKLFYALID